ncbi:MAG: hypothetical protein LLF93_05830 [Bacteroidales bacterium]|nr:hypothetical protein [Bacteroidales bacterium]
MKNNLRIISVFIISLLLTLTFSCKKEVPKVIPTLTTTDVSNITSTTALGGGSITSDGGAAVAARGVCWSLSQSPTTTDSKTSDGAGIGSFTSTITGLTPGITYYVRAYATNSIGTSYGSQLTLTALAIIPTLTTTAITDIGSTSATSGGSITSDGGSTIISRGVCWSTNQTPTIANSKTVETSGLSIFTSSIIGLMPSTTYYVRSYATNSVGTGYGNAISVTSLRGIFFNPDLTYGSVTDIDGNKYKTILIGTQTWMAENLKTTKYRDGNLIETTNPVWLNIQGNVEPKYQWAYDGNESNIATYGRLYTWYTATDSRNVCPIGWHVPTDAEWTILTTYLGGENIAGSKLREAGVSYWEYPKGATNETGFTALPSGYRHVQGPFFGKGAVVYWWSSKDSGLYSYNAWYRHINYDHSDVYREEEYKYSGLSVRCIKD